MVGPEDQPSEELAREVAGVDPSPDSAPAQVHQSGISMLVAHAEDPGILGNGSGGPGGAPLLMQLGTTSLLSVPLVYGDHRYGALTLARAARHGHFGMADVGLVEELGEQLALAMRAGRVLRHRTEIADALQASLLPRHPRQLPGAEVAAGHLAAIAQYVGSDFYDSYPARRRMGHLHRRRLRRPGRWRPSPPLPGMRSACSRTRTPIRRRCCAAPTRS